MTERDGSNTRIVGLHRGAISKEDIVVGNLLVARLGV